MRAVAEELLEASALCAISTVSPGGRAHVNTAYFGWTPDLRIVWMSEPRVRHSRNLRARPSAAVAVYNSTQTWGRPDRGIQLFGSARPTRDDTAYAARFPEYESFEAYRAYEFVPNRVKLFDERSFGAATFVTGHLGREGRLAWERTEVYNSRR